MLVFFDDILVYSKTTDAHFEHLKKVFHLLQAHELKVKIEKCQFGKQQAQYRGHLFSKQGVAVDPSKIEAMVSWPKPQIVRAMCGFLGLIGYYRKLIQNYGRLLLHFTR